MMRRILAHIQPTTRQLDINSTIHFEIMPQQQLGVLDVILEATYRDFKMVPIEKAIRVKEQDTSILCLRSLNFSEEDP
jgi:hypothetical protein